MVLPIQIQRAISGSGSLSFKITKYCYFSFFFLHIFFSFLVTIIDVGSLTFNGKMSVINNEKHLVLQHVVKDVVSLVARALTICGMLHLCL